MYETASVRPDQSDGLLGARLLVSAHTNRSGRTVDDVISDLEPVKERLEMTSPSTAHDVTAVSSALLLLRAMS